VPVKASIIKLVPLIDSKNLLSAAVTEKLHAFMDPTMRSDYPLDMAYSLAEITKCCVARDHNLRPNISEVLIILSKIHSSSLDWDPSDEVEETPVHLIKFQM
jgi:hypothetical protein